MSEKLNEMAVKQAEEFDEKKYAAETGFNPQSVTYSQFNKSYNKNTVQQVEQFESESKESVRIENTSEGRAVASLWKESKGFIKLVDAVKSAQYDINRSVTALLHKAAYKAYSEKNPHYVTVALSALNTAFTSNDRHNKIKACKYYLECLGLEIDGKSCDCHSILNYADQRKRFDAMKGKFVFSLIKEKKDREFTDSYVLSRQTAERLSSTVANLQKKVAGLAKSADKLGEKEDSEQVAKEVAFLNAMTQVCAYFTECSNPTAEAEAVLQWINANKELRANDRAAQ